MRVFWSFMLLLFMASMGAMVVPDRATQGAEAEILKEPLSAPSRSPSESLSSEQRAEILSGLNESLELAMKEMAAGLDQSVIHLELLASQDTAAAQGVETGQNTVDVSPDSVSQIEDLETATESTPAIIDPFAAAAAAYLNRNSGAAEADNAAGESEVVAAVVDPAPEPENKTELVETAEQVSEAASFVVQNDGSLLIDGVTTVPGDGSESNPFVLDWNLLTSVGREYHPEKGKNELPAWLGAIEGKRVRLTGHVVLPLVSTSTDELLLTMNPWDGCCVGVPPTPFDALEVTLGESVSFEGASMYGAVEGTFRTDPYIVSGWLLGLYLLDDAVVVK